VLYNFIHTPHQDDEMYNFIHTPHQGQKQGENLMEQLTPVQLSNMVDTQFAGKTIKINSFKTEPPKINGLISIPLFTDGDYGVLMVDEVNFVEYTEIFDIKREYFYTFKDGMAFIFTNDERLKLFTPEIFESADIAQYVKRFLVNVFDAYLMM